MVNVFPPDHVDDLPDLAPAIPEPALVDENEGPKEGEKEFKEKEEFEEEEPQEEEDMEVDIGEEENELELMFPYEEADPLNPSPPASDSESKDVVEVEDMVKPEDETIPNSIHEMAHALVEKKGKAKDKYYGKLIADLGNEVRCSVGKREAVLEDRIKEFGNAEERAECKKLKKELEDARIMPPKSGPMTQASIERMITSRIDAALTADKSRKENVKNNAGGAADLDK
nr:hypothetical protein [Tanacetum cinerariifolium]